MTDRNPNTIAVLHIHAIVFINALFALFLNMRAKYFMIVSLHNNLIVSKTYKSVRFVSFMAGVLAALS